MTPRVGGGKSEATHLPPEAVCKTGDTVDCGGGGGCPAWRTGVSAT